MMGEKLYISKYTHTIYRDIIISSMSDDLIFEVEMISLLTRYSV